MIVIILNAQHFAFLPNVPKTNFFFFLPSTSCSFHTKKLAWTKLFCEITFFITKQTHWQSVSFKWCIPNASVKGNLELSPPQGSTQIRRRDDVESWGVYFQGLVNLDLINFLTMWIFTLCELRPGESWTNAVYISSENVLNTKIDCSKNVLLIVVLEEYKLKWMCC